MSLPTVITGCVAAPLESMAEVHHQVCGSLKVAGQSMKQHYDQHMRDASYAVGDRVWLYNPRKQRGLSLKLQSPWKGPYSILESLSDITYWIWHTRQGWGRSCVVYMDRL